jgi:hypothetical protein
MAPLAPSPPLAAAAPPFLPLPAGSGFFTGLLLGMAVKKESRRPWLDLPLEALIFLTVLRTRSSAKFFSPGRWRQQA